MGSEYRAFSSDPNTQTIKSFAMSRNVNTREAIVDKLSTTPASAFSEPLPKNPASHIEIDVLDQMVSGPRLLEILWDSASRPSYRWLQYQCARRIIPFCRSGGRTWFVPRQVREALTKPPVRRGRPPASPPIAPVFVCPFQQANSSAKAPS